jgi:hypothetical protein
MPAPSKEAMTTEMRRVFGNDQKRISHALSVLSFAERILQREQADSNTVIAAALLHDIGIQEAERKYNSNAGRYQEIEGPPIAKRMLESLGASPQFVSEVCDIIGHHHSPRETETLNFMVLYDSDLIVNLRDELEPSRLAGMKEKLERMFFTETGLDVARDTFFGTGG